MAASFIIFAYEKLIIASKADVLFSDRKKKVVKKNKQIKTNRVYAGCYVRFFFYFFSQTSLILLDEIY